jgi:hypothetical protein
MTNLLRDAESELAALADGSLAPELRARALAGVRGSSELQAALAEQRRVVEMMAAVEVGAPAALRGAVEEMIAAKRGVRASGRRALPRPRLGLAAAALATAAVVAAAVVGPLGGGSPSSPLNVQQAAALALSPATSAAPFESATHRAQLAVSVEGVPFPYWKERFGWRSTGTRSDRLAGRAVTTVFYANREGRRIGYAIVSGRAPETSGGTIVRRWDVWYRLLAHDGATVVTWRRDGHLCVVAGRGVSARTLLSLASWGSAKPQTA